MKEICWLKLKFLDYFVYSKIHLEAPHYKKVVNNFDKLVEKLS